MDKQRPRDLRDKRGQHVDPSVAGWWQDLSPIGRTPRIALLNEGTYPVARGGVSTWCDHLVTQLSEHQFSVVTLVGDREDSVWDLPDNVGYIPVPMWAPPRRRWSTTGMFRRMREASVVERAYHDLWHAVLPADSGDPGARSPDLSLATDALATFAGGFSQPLLWMFQDGVGTQALMEAWEGHRTAAGLPELTGSQAAQIAGLVDRILAVVDVRFPDVDVLHVSSNGAPALMALTRHWRDGTPIVITEHGVHLRERYLALNAAHMSWVVRYAVMAFTRVICRIAYEHATLITPVSAFNARWEEQLGADPRRVIAVPNGVDASSFPQVSTEPDVPTVSFVGRITPIKDLETLLEAFALVRASIPHARLRIFGPSGDRNYQQILETLVFNLDIYGAVTFEGPAASAVPAIEAGHVVALSSISEGLPYTVIESMMCGRATVSTDVGGVSEVVGLDEECGLLVPPRDPQAMALALVRLLRDDAERTRMGANARERALRVFGIDTFVERHRTIYGAVAAGLTDDDLDDLRAALTDVEPDPVPELPMPANVIDLRQIRASRMHGA